MVAENINLTPNNPNPQGGAQSQEQSQQPVGAATSSDEDTPF